MSTLIPLFGILTIATFFIAALNGLKRYIKLPLLRTLSLNHHLIAGLAALFSVMHLILNLVEGQFKLSGLLLIIILFSTLSLSGMIKQTKNRKIIPFHRLFVALTFVFFLIHII
jgi:hypothetical protein